MKILICGLGSIGMRHFNNFRSLVDDFISTEREKICLTFQLRLGIYFLRSR